MPFQWKGYMQGTAHGGMHAGNTSTALLHADQAIVPMRLRLFRCSGRLLEDTPCFNPPHPRKQNKTIMQAPGGVTLIAKHKSCCTMACVKQAYHTETHPQTHRDAHTTHRHTHTDMNTHTDRGTCMHTSVRSAKLDVSDAHQLMQRPNRNMTRAYRLLMAVLWPTSWVGSPFRRIQERGRERRTLSCAVMMRPAFGHLLERTSPAQ